MNAYHVIQRLAFFKVKQMIVALQLVVPDLDPLCFHGLVNVSGLPGCHLVIDTAVHNVRGRAVEPLLDSRGDREGGRVYRSSAE